jgi:hypothetical protein
LEGVENGIGKKRKTLGEEEEEEEEEAVRDRVFKEEKKIG